jgi:A/G-specific adenine glycosylase
MNFSKTIITWYIENRRDLPWRHTKDPYKIWLSEIILQQTRVVQGLPYYEAFIKKFPTISDLATADEDTVLHLWQGLGYYSRARNLHQTAKIIHENYNDAFPNRFKELLKLKGVGPYTAAAIASFAFGEAVALVDGNVYRVLSRIYGIQTNIASSGAYKEFFELASNLMDDSQPDVFNQALMEFGAMACTPKNPNCTFCPFIQNCIAYQTGKVSELPIKINKTKIRKRYLLYIVWRDVKGRFYVQQRTQKDIWQKLYEFDLIESTKGLDWDTVQEIAYERAKNNHWSIESLKISQKEPVLHKLSHQNLEILFLDVNISELVNTFVSPNKLQYIGLPIVLRNYLEKIYAFENDRYLIAAEEKLRKIEKNRT